MTTMNPHTCEILEEGHARPAGFAGFISGLAEMSSRLLRSLKNRSAVNELRHLSEDQLADMGLNRDDVAKALSRSITLDPSYYLVKARMDPLRGKRHR